MKKQIKFQQISANQAYCHIRNIFGSTLSQVQDKIKKNQGKWDKQSRRYVIPLDKISPYCKEVQCEIDKTISIEHTSQKVMDFIKKFSYRNRKGKDHKIKRKLFVDRLSVNRYGLVKELTADLLSNKHPTVLGSSFNGKVNILLVCPKQKIQNWICCLNTTGFFKGIVGNNQCQNQKKQNQKNGIYVTSAQQYSNQQIQQQIISLNFSGAIFDCFQYFLRDSTISQQTFQRIKQYIFRMQFSYFISDLVPFQEIDKIIQLVTQFQNLNWLKKRYRNQFYQELLYLLNQCNICEDIGQKEYKNLNKFNLYGCHLNKSQSIHTLLIQLPQASLDKIKSSTRKHSGNGLLNAKILLSDLKLYRIRNKNQKNFIDTMIQILNKEKFQYIKECIYNVVTVLRQRIAIVIENSQFYRIFQNYCCDKQINYSHFEHYKQVLDFNTNPTVRVCLVKLQTLIKYHEERNDQDYIQNDLDQERIENYLNQQYQCLSGINKVFFIDANWANMLQNRSKRQLCIRQCFNYIPNLTRYCFVIKGSYEEKWIAEFCEQLYKNEYTLQKEKKNQQENQFDDEDDALTTFELVQQAGVLQQYGHCKNLKGILDIDDEFDKFQYEAMIQKKERQERKKRKAEKVKKKQEEAEIKKNLEKAQQELQKEYDKNNEYCEQQCSIFVRQDFTTQESGQKKQSSFRKSIILDEIDEELKNHSLPRKKVKTQYKNKNNKQQVQMILLQEKAAKGNSNLRILLTPTQSDEDV